MRFLSSDKIKRRVLTGLLALTLAGGFVSLSAAPVQAASGAADTSKKAADAKATAQEIIARNYQEQLQQMIAAMDPQTRKAAGYQPVLTREMADQDQAAGRVYDMILFWGQSNMVGQCMGQDLPALAGDPAGFSARTGIAQDLVSEAQSVSSLLIPLENGSSYEYIPSTGSFSMITAGIKIGDSVQGMEGDVYDPVTGTLHGYTRTSGELPCTYATGVTNMIPEFCRQYTALTGHRVLAVMAAAGGASIEAFLPVSDPNYLPAPAEAGTAYAYLQEGAVSAWNHALAAARDLGIHVQGKYWISMQGEADLFLSSYEADYEKVIGTWRKLGMTRGALVETAFTAGNPDAVEVVEKMHTFQQNLIRKNKDMILGSSFVYDHYLPDEKHYKGKWQKQWGNLPYEEALLRASLLADTVPGNQIHLNALTLSQVGREAATALAAQVMAQP